MKRTRDTHTHSAVFRTSNECHKNMSDKFIFLTSLALRYIVLR